MNIYKLCRALLFTALIAGALFVYFWNYSGTIFPLETLVVNKAGRFESKASLPIARTESGSTVHEGVFYILGGISAWAQSLQSFSAYYPETDSWEELAGLPEVINHPNLVAADGKIYVVGGFGPLGIRIHGFMFARWNPLNSLYIYDIKEKTWGRGPNLPDPRGAGGATVADGAIWYAGGIAPDLEINAALFRYDLKEKSWLVMPPMSVARDHLRMESVDKSLFAISGRKDDMRYNLAVTERYDIDTQSWSRVADIPLARGGFGSAVYKGNIYTFGGELVWTCVQQIERFDPIQNKWEILGLLPEPRHGIQAGVIEDGIHLVSGGRHPRVSISGIHRVFYPKLN